MLQNLVLISLQSMKKYLKRFVNLVTVKDAAVYMLCLLN